MDQSQTEKIRNICLRYQEAFYVEGDKLKTTNIYEHTIKLKPDVDTIFIRQYRVPEIHKQEINKQINELLEKNIIEKSTSRFNSPILLVKKHSDYPNKPNYRLVIDYRKLNEATIPQVYPMPLIDEVADHLQNSEVFTILDVYSAFHQIQLSKECRPLTAFSTSKEHYQFRCTPFELQSSPIAWLYTINNVLREIANENIFWYMDDIISSHTQDEVSNLKIFKKVLKQLIKYNIKLKPEKCKFLRKNVKFLGYNISKHGLEIDYSKTKTIKEYA